MVTCWRLSIKEYSQKAMSKSALGNALDIGLEDDSDSDSDIDS